MPTGLTDQREGRDLDLAAYAVEAGDGQAAVCRMALAQRDHERHLLWGYLVAAAFGGEVDGGPFIGRHLAGFLESVPEDRLGGLVVEDQRPGRIDDEDRQ